jgi:hypothetical protein
VPGTGKPEMGKQLAVNGKPKTMNEWASEHCSSENRIRKEPSAVPPKENGDGKLGRQPPSGEKNSSGQNCRPKTQHWRSKKTQDGACSCKID